MRNLSRWIVCSLLISQWLVGLSSFCLCCILNSDRDPNIRLVIFAKCVHTINTISSMHVLSFSPAFQREWAQRHCYCLLTTFFIPSTNTDNGMRRITWRSCAHALKKTQYKHIYISAYKNTYTLQTTHTLMASECFLLFRPDLPENYDTFLVFFSFLHCLALGIVHMANWLVSFRKWIVVDMLSWKVTIRNFEWDIPKCYCPDLQLSSVRLTENVSRRCKHMILGSVWNLSVPRKIIKSIELLENGGVSNVSNNTFIFAI